MARPAFQAPKGVAEYLPPDSADFLAVREGLSAPAIRSGYLYAEVPVFEDTALFTHGIKSTDFVSRNDLNRCGFPCDPAPADIDYF